MFALANHEFLVRNVIVRFVCMFMHKWRPFEVLPAQVDGLSESEPNAPSGSGANVTRFVHIAERRPFLQRAARLMVLCHRAQRN